MDVNWWFQVDLNDHITVTLLPQYQPISETVVPITHLDTKTWENRVQVEKYLSYPFRFEINMSWNTIYFFQSFTQYIYILFKGTQ